MENLYIVMPAYNEEENIVDVVDKWYSVLDGKGEKSKLIVADSGSKDSTHVILLELQKKYPKLEILANTKKQHGPKVWALYDYAIKNEIEYVFQTDSDGQTNPEEFNSFWNLRKDYDGIFGHRKNRKDGKSRVIVEYIVCGLLKIYFGVKVPDANAPFRLMKVDTIKKYLYKMDSNYNLPNIMLTTYFVYYEEKCTFRRISFMPRQGGVNSVNIPKIVCMGFKALKDFKVLRKGMR